MQSSTPTNAGRSAGTIALHSALAGLLGLGLAAPTQATDKAWNTVIGNWNNPANWIPFGVPGPDDEIHIGNVPGVQNGTVMLMPPGASYDYLAITNGMTLDMNNNELVSFDDAYILGAGSRIIVRPAGGLNDHDFQGVLHVGPGAHFEMLDNAPVRVHGASESSGTISGRGLFQASTFVPFVNNGVIQPSNNGGLTVQAGNSSNQPFDLDGTTGNGHLLLDLPFAALTLEADSLTDPFSGTITMTRGAAIDMEVAQGWTADAACVIDIEGTNDPNAASQIHGSDWVFDGTLNVNSFQAHLRILSDVTFAQNAEVIVAYTDWLELDGVTTVAGAHFTLGNQGILDFDGQTIMQAGTFDTNSSDPANGSVDFNGPVTWNGGCAVNGIARQFGNAFVSGPSVIDADVFDMDGDGDTQWTVWNDLVINADSVQSNGAEDFYGSITVASTNGRLMVNLPGAEPLFSMAGTMNLIGHPAVYHTRYAGTALDLLGGLFVSGKVIMEGYLRALDGTIDIGAENAVLQLDAGGLITAACAFTGDGELRIGPGSAPLFTGADLNGVGLMNQGTLKIQSVAFVDRLEGAPGSTWDLSLQGHDAGVDYDQLVVANAATLGGNLSITLQSDFVPEPADSFTVLTAIALEGTFENVVNGGRVITSGGEGSFLVSYDGATDTVVLSDYLPCPADVNRDGTVDVSDLVRVIIDWGLVGSSLSDVTGDLVVDVADLVEVILNWGDCP